MLYTTGGKSRVENVWQAGVNWKEEAAVLRDRRRGGSGTTRERKADRMFLRPPWLAISGGRGQGWVLRNVVENSTAVEAPQEKRGIHG